MINRDFKSAFFAATFFLVGLASMADVLAQNGATLKFALPNLLRNERQVVAVIDKPLTGKLDLDFSHQVLVLDQAVDPSAIDYFLITTSDADSEQVAYWENVVDGVTQTYLFNAKHLSMRTAIEVDEFTNRTLIAHNLDGRGVVDINHFGGITVNAPNELKVPSRNYDAVSKLLTSKTGVDDFLSKASVPGDCLTVYAYLNQRYPERKMELLIEPFGLAKVKDEAEFQGAWIEIKTSTSSIKVMMTPIALGEILNSHWREFLVSCLK